MLLNPLGIFQAIPLELPAVTPRFDRRPDRPHVTLAWGVPEKKYDVAEPVTSIYFDAECWDDRIQAIRCQLQAGIPFESHIPHCTISWAAGVKPVEATKMLQCEHQGAPVGQWVDCTLIWVPLIDSVRAYRQKILKLLAHQSMGAACEQLELKPSTARGWFKRLPEDDPDRVLYEAFVRGNKGGWKAGKKRRPS